MSEKKNIWFFVGGFVVICIAIPLIFLVNNKDLVFGFSDQQSDGVWPEFDSYDPPCKKGDVHFDFFGEEFCYPPSGHKGELCDRKSDCGSAGCALTGRRITGPVGVCTEVPFGCNKWIDDDGNVADGACVD